MKKGNSIYFWRIIFTYMIVIFHFGGPFALYGGFVQTPGWYIAVEFFFLVSGYLLYENIDRYKEKYKSAWRYTLHRYEEIYPKYMVAFVITFVCVVLYNGLQKMQIFDLLCDSFWEILLLQGIGLDREWNYINPTLWYISVLLLAGYLFCYFLMKHKEVFVKIIAPIVMLVFYSVLYRKIGTLNAVMQMDGFYGNYALMRGIADMCLGMYACIFSHYLRDRFEKLQGIKFIGICAFLTVILLSLNRGNSAVDYPMTFLLFIGVTAAFLPTESGFLNSIFIRKWSSITLNIYLLHEIFRSYIFPTFFMGEYTMPERIMYHLMYIGCVTVAAILLEVLYVLILKPILVRLKGEKHEV